MISPAWCRMMAAYNAEMNCRLYAAAGTLDDAARRADGGAFWGSIHGTLSHLVWGDTIWMARFDGWEPPSTGIRDSARLLDDWAALEAARVAADARMVDWSGRLDEPWLAGTHTWFSGAAGRELTRPLWVLVAHMFNHQTHHRGQVHALLTRAGAATGDTDLPWVVDLGALGIAR
jgi:uncharacterized damage-inducible protein DinB